MCPKCEGQTKASTDNSRKLGWVWRRTPEHVNQYMDLHFRKRTRLMKIPEVEQADLFMKDIAKVYAGYGNENMEM
ncbi:hypothetical protein CEXT_809391 [Caerostris extrusa]|uniref:Uncharacterized protein n=1 Tax=Caerostris extrusa TaxID=172846 RepID=A0AAV4R1K1_CAEEX|nr:hypothetical protein CEXT_809391 [Caerostris extrusa]